MAEVPVIIAGAGPAGIACAIQLKHAGVPALLVSRGPVGGLLRNAFRVRNLPGFFDATGDRIVAELRGHLARLEVPVLEGEVRDVRATSRGVTLTVNGERRECAWLVAATGTSPLPGPERDPSPRVFDEVAGMASVREARVAVVGAGEAGLDSALTLASRDNTVIVLGPAIPPSVSGELLRMVREEPRVRCELGARVSRVTRRGEGGLRVEAGTLGLEVDFALICVGRRPELSFLGAEDALRSDRVLLCGDVRRGGFRQAAIAMGDGVAAAMEIIRRQTDAGRG